MEKTIKEIKDKHAQHEKVVNEKLTKAGVESPRELINRVGSLRSQIKTIETVKKPRLVEVKKLLDKKREEREGLLTRLHELNTAITEKRKKKAEELTRSLSDQIRITIMPFGDKVKYREVLDGLCDEIATKGSRLQNREGQLERIVSNVTPAELAVALKNKGVVREESGQSLTLVGLCNVTGNTQNILCRIADNVNLLNKLETLIVDDVPQIRVLRRGEAEYADLSSGLSPGEQRAAILTLALQTGSRPLIIDQPEDELGYSFVVHLIVPKILEAKFSRQMLIVTHNANIPVLGDADYLIKMENKPRPDYGRMCVVSDHGCFESPSITKALIELEGGKAAFQFRQYRYSLPKTSSSTPVPNAAVLEGLEKELTSADELFK